MGFVNPVASILDGFGVEKDARGNAKATTDVGGYATNVAQGFAAGDMRRGQSLVVWAIREGRQAARAVDEFLMGSTACRADGKTGKVVGHPRVYLNPNHADSRSSGFCILTPHDDALVEMATSPSGMGMAARARGRQPDLCRAARSRC